MDEHASLCDCSCVQFGPEMGDTASFAHFPFILIKWLPIPEDRVDTGRDC